MAGLSWATIDGAPREVTDRVVAILNDRHRASLHAEMRRRLKRG